MPPKLISIEEARGRVLAEAIALPVEPRPFALALGMALAEEVIAPQSVPPFDNSGMDGFAVRAVDTVDATADAPVCLSVAKTIAAGHVADRPLMANEAIKIMTGAPIPEGADSVVQVEVTEEIAAGVRISSLRSGAGTSGGRARTSPPGTGSSSPEPSWALLRSVCLRVWAVPRYVCTNGPG